MDDRSELCSLKIFVIKVLVKSYLPIKDSHLRLGFANLLEILKNVLAFGEILKDMESSHVDRAHMRLVSAKAVLRLSKDWDHKIPIDIFHLTLRTSEIIDSQVKKLFLGKEKNKKFKNMRSKQVFPNTGSRRGYARLENDMKSAKPSSVVRVDVWPKAHTKANGEPSNEEVAKNLVKIEELKKLLPLNSTAPPLKMTCFPKYLDLNDKIEVAELEEQLAAIMGKMEKMSNLISKLIRNQAQSVSEAEKLSMNCIISAEIPGTAGVGKMTGYSRTTGAGGTPCSIGTNPKLS
ncbi:hypothetical protein GIB67_018641 [Kingdonia uniflora]|uniref:Uncharacterized protein n=1 Tax=Kingdonia uniflora TaxID=39325 RepID=A0A7J7M2H9_9MAGN|nr:hypothetical protein GIB67_018641 [Kingdonia uniflora]